MPEHGHEWMSLRRVAELMGVSERTVYRWTNDGLPIVLRGRHRWTRRDWLDAYLDGRKTTVARCRHGHQVTGLLVVVAASVGMLVEMSFMLELHPAGIDVDALAAIVVAVVIALAGERYGGQLLRRVNGRRQAPGRARRPAGGKPNPPDGGFALARPSGYAGR